MAGMADEEDSRSFVIVSDDEDYFCHDDALSPPPYNSAILFLAKLQVIYALQRVWRLKVNSSITGKAVINDKFTVTSDIKCKQFPSSIGRTIDDYLSRMASFGSSLFGKYHLYFV